MGELWDIYDAQRNLTGRTHRRGEPFPQGYYHLVVHVWVQNSRGEFFITKRAAEKRAFPLLWEAPGGSALAGEDSLTAALREYREETGLALNPVRGECLLSFRREKGYDDFCDVWLFRQDLDPADFVPQQGETIAARLAAPEILSQEMEAGVFCPCAYWGELSAYCREQQLVCPAPGTSAKAIESLLADTFCEVGASGGICSRAEAVECLISRSITAQGNAWSVTEFSLKVLAEDICLATYKLVQGERITRRATLWQRKDVLWQAVYHQGTLLQ